MARAIVLLAIVVVIVVGAIVLVVLFPSDEQRMARERRRATGRAVVVEDEIVTAAADNYRLLERYRRFVQTVLDDDQDVPFLSDRQRSIGEDLNNEFDHYREKKGRE